VAAAAAAAAATTDNVTAREPALTRSRVEPRNKKRRRTDLLDRM